MSVVVANGLGRSRWRSNRAALIGYELPVLENTQTELL